MALYAPWASSHIDCATPYAAIGCRTAVDEHTGKRSLRVVQDAHNITHWVACIKGDKCHGDGECAIDEATVTFHAVYLSFGRMVMETIGDGDCGLDAMCLMLARRLCKQKRDSLRSALAPFAFKHIGNRAFIAMLHSVGELSSHLGLFELESAGAEMLADSGAAELVPAIGAELVVDAAKESHHGEGGGPLIDLATADATQRNFSEEEMRAVTWKCRLRKSSPEFIL